MQYGSRMMRLVHNLSLISVLAELGWMWLASIELETRFAAQGNIQLTKWEHLAFALYDLRNNVFRELKHMFLDQVEIVQLQSNPRSSFQSIMPTIAGLNKGGRHATTELDISFNYVKEEPGRAWAPKSARSAVFSCARESHICKGATV